MTGFSGRLKLKRDTKSCGERQDAGKGRTSGEQKSRDEVSRVGERNVVKFLRKLQVRGAVTQFQLCIRDNYVSCNYRATTDRRSSEMNSRKIECRLRLRRTKIITKHVVDELISSRTFYKPEELPVAVP